MRRTWANHRLQTWGRCAEMAVLRSWVCGWQKESKREVGGVSKCQGPAYRAIEDHAKGPRVAAAAVVAAFAAKPFEVGGPQGRAGCPRTPALWPQAELAAWVCKWLDIDNAGLLLAAAKPPVDFGVQIMLHEEDRVAEQLWRIAPPTSRLGKPRADVRGGGNPCPGWTQDARDEFVHSAEPQQDEAYGVACNFDG